MTASLTEQRPTAPPVAGDLAALAAYTSALVGEPFRLARVTYGGELTLHFGDLRPAKSPKLVGYLYGSYILGVCASPWLLKSADCSRLIEGGADFEPPPGRGRLLTNAELHADPLVTPGARVTSAEPFAVAPTGAFGLHLGFADGSSFFAQPAAPRPPEPGDEHLPPLADWELTTPAGDLDAGPGPGWTFAARG